jgi:hypothetical protein
VARLSALENPACAAYRPKLSYSGGNVNLFSFADAGKYAAVSAFFRFSLLLFAGVFAIVYFAGIKTMENAAGSAGH